MKQNKDKTTALTLKDFNEFLSATGNEQWKILLAHAERNSATIELKAAENCEPYEAERKNQNKT